MTSHRLDRRAAPAGPSTRSSSRARMRSPRSRSSPTWPARSSPSAAHGGGRRAAGSKIGPRCKRRRAEPRRARRASMSRPDAPSFTLAGRDRKAEPEASLLAGRLSPCAVWEVYEARAAARLPEAAAAAPRVPARSTQRCITRAGSAAILIALGERAGLLEPPSGNWRISAFRTMSRHRSRRAEQTRPLAAEPREDSLLPPSKTAVGRVAPPTS